jgi:hypothetical protein
MGIDQPGDGRRVEEALRAQAVRRQHVAGEGLQVATQPRGGRDREPPLRRTRDALRQQRRDRVTQEPLLREPAHLHPARKREGQLGDHLVAERNPGL